MKFVKTQSKLNLLKRLVVFFVFPIFTFVISVPNQPVRKIHAVNHGRTIQGKNPDVVEEKYLKRHLFTIASDEYEGRGAGYEGERKVTDYIAGEFKKYGLVPMGDKSDGKKTYFQNFTFHPRKPEKPFQILNSRNVLGFIGGSDRNLRKEIVVIGCHHDGQGKTGQADGGRLLAEDKSLMDEIWNSADDNGTGVAVLLEVARIISKQEIKPRRSILFATFGAEEHALNGSAFYVASPAFKWKRHVAMLNLEKLGRIPDAMPITASSGTSPIWEKVTNKANKKTGMNVKSIIAELISDTDHYPFAMRKIPAMVIGMAHEEDTHQPTDSVEKISFDKLAQRTEYVLTAFLELANTTEKMSFTGDLRGEVGFMTVMTSDAELDKLGLNSGQGGFKVSMIIPKFPADKAGIKLGDFIVAVDGKNLTRKDKDERIFFKDNTDKKRFLKLTILRKGKHKTLVLRLSD